MGLTAILSSLMSMSGMLSGMQWHWGNIGSAVAGLSAFVIAVAALIRSPAALAGAAGRRGGRRAGAGGG